MPYVSFTTHQCLCRLVNKYMGLKIVICHLLVASSLSVVEAQVKNGFRLTNATIPVEEIKHGGPPRDGIPSLDHPQFISPVEADFLDDNDLIIGLNINEQQQAYPIKILNWHEVVNDIIGGQEVVVTYCPLCRSAVVFNSRINDRVLSFGVSGLLYNSDVLLYDRQTESLWSQLLNAAISGEYSGTILEMIPSQVITWKEWRAKHPDTRVLSDETGFSRAYQSSPYELYELSDHLMFPVTEQNYILPNKELVLGVRSGKRFIAFPLKELRKSENDVIYKSVTVKYDQSRKSAIAYNTFGEVVPSVTLYWFAWYAFHPNTLIYRHRN